MRPGIVTLAQKPQPATKKTMDAKELEKQVTVLESKKKVNKKEVATLKRKVTTTKKHIVEAKKAVEFDDSDEALKYLKMAAYFRL